MSRDFSTCSLHVKAFTFPDEGFFELFGLRVISLLNINVELMSYLWDCGIRTEYVYIIESILRHKFWKCCPCRHILRESKGICPYALLTIDSQIVFKSNNLDEKLLASESANCLQFM